MLTDHEVEAGITYEELGINLDRCRGVECKTFCPWCHANRKNQRDKSLSVNTEKGVFNCHNCGRHSGLGIEARERANRALPFSGGTAPSQAARRSVGTAESEATSSAPQSQVPSVPRELPPELHPWASEWLEFERGIPKAVQEHFSLRSLFYVDKENGEAKQVIHFPYFLNGEHVNTKHRTLPKQFTQERGTARTLYNIDACEDAATIVIAEGELDVLACATAGWEECVSSPDGAGKAGKTLAAFDEETAKKAFANASKIIIAVDGDEPGREYAKALIDRFGPERCWTVQWPAGCKDANDVLLKHGATELDKLLGHAKPCPLPGVRPISVHRDALLKIYDEGFSPGVSTGWPDFDNLYRPVPGELVIVSGYPSHGKTSWLNHFFTNLSMKNDWNIGFYSPENGEEGEVLGKFVAIAQNAPWVPTAERRMDKASLDQGIEWVGQRMWEIYSEESDSGGFASLTVPKILELAEPLALKRNLKALVIDPWNECEAARGPGQSVEEYISASLSTIRRWAKRNQVCVFVVIHPRKPDSIKTAEDTPPEPYEAAGAAHWYNKADVFMTIHRIKFGEGAGTTTVHIKKHRREGISGSLGSMSFTYDRRSGRFYSGNTVIPGELGTDAYTGVPVNVFFSAQQQAAEPKVEQYEMADIPF